MKSVNEIVDDLLHSKGKDIICSTRKPRKIKDYLVGEYKGKLIYTYAKLKK